MRKIGIITFHRAINFGAVLQTYALQRSIELLGGDAGVVDYISRLYDHYQIRKSSNPIKSLFYLVFDKYKRKSIKRFNRFVEQYLNLSEKCWDKSTLEGTVSNAGYSALITGSDQVWNPDLVHGDPCYLLDFDNDSFDRYSYAASIGVDCIENDLGTYYKSVLEKYRSISVRERSAIQILNNYGITQIGLVCDPTLLLQQQEWELIENKINLPSKYVLFFAFGHNSDLLFCAKKYAASIGATLCIVTDSIIPMKDTLALRGLGPAEWIYAIHNSECVFTNSYHGLLFSIIFHKDFWVDDPKDGTNSRLLEMLDILNLKDRTISSFNFNSIATRYYKESSARFQKLVEYSKQYLQSIIDNTPFSHDIVIKGSPIGLDTGDSSKSVISFDKACSGCSACMLACPVDAIYMKINYKGQKYPVIKDSDCIKCGKCKTTCPIGYIPKADIGFKQEYYAVKNKNHQDVSRASSGGVFLLLARRILQRGGCVYGVVFDDLSVVYGRAETVDELWRISGTKYVESDKGQVFSLVKKDLDAGKTVLFSGTPCTISGLIRAVGNNSKGSLITVDIICHGVPAPVIYESYIKYQEKKHRSKVSNINFRSKVYDDEAKRYTQIQRMGITFTNGRQYFSSSDTDPFYRLFWSGNILRECCYKCQYACLNRVSDITLGDYWGRKTDTVFFSENSESSVLVNTAVGKRLFDSVSNEAEVLKVSKDDIMQRNLYMASTRGKKEKLFWYDYLTHSFQYVLFRYADTSGLFRMIGKLRGNDSE